MGYLFKQTTIVFSVLCVFAQDNAELNDNVRGDDYSIIPEEKSEVHGIDASDTAIAIATSKRLYLYHLTSPVQLIGKIDLSPAVTEQPGFLELKLLSDTAIGYCDTTLCCYCTFNPNYASCRSLNLTFGNQTADFISSVSMAFEHPVLTLRLVDNNKRAAILLYNVLEASESKPINAKQTAVDLITSFKQVTNKGFVRDGHSYFLGTKSRSTDQSSLKSNDSTMIITRICNNDGTEQLESRMELHIKCVYEAIVGINAAYYDPKRDQLWIIVLSAKNQEFCRFDMEVVQERFNSTWNACLESNENDLNICERADNSKELPAHCHIYNRRSNNGARPCFNNNPTFRSGNCEMNYVSTEKNPFGWLENTKQLRGEYCLDIVNIPPLVRNIVPDVIYNNTFTAIPHKDYTLVSWYPTHYYSTISTVKFLPNKKLFTKMHHNIAISGDSLFIIDLYSVQSLHISCDGFHKTCESILEEAGGLKAPIKCFWCADKDKQMALSFHDANHGCIEQITKTCPANSKRNITAALLRRRKHAGVSSVKDTNRRGKVNDKGTDWMMVSVLTGVILMLAVLTVFILRDLRKTTRLSSSIGRPTELGHNSRPLLTGTTYADANSTSGTIISARLSSSSRTKYDCGKLFKDIDEHIKIDISCLQLEELIGEGNFGLVLRGNYIAPDGDIIKVACKMLKSGQTGVKAFFDEGMTMMKFHHDRVIPFIGFSISNGTDPIIVTKFMTNGNLLSYLQKNAKSISGEQIQDFAMQIAEGMKYLHSKKFIHRDLAARNCMLDYKMELKIGDFGLARQCNDENMYLSRNHPKVPFPWASLEALEFGTFTLKGDIWSYGVVLWELMTKGEKPYSNYTPSGLLQFLKEGKRLCRPQDCTAEFYTSIMIPCWDEDMQNRPSFSKLIKELNEF